MTQKIIDLSMTIEEGMQTFPTHWHPFVEITQLGRHGLENRETRKIVLGTHTGTHIDAPRHFVDKGDTVDNVKLDQLVGQALVVDFSELPHRTEVTKEMLEEKVNGRDVTRVIFRYDWCKLLGSMDYYSELPYLSEEACEWLVEKGCLLIAMDTPMPDNPQNGKNSDNDSPNHKILLGNNVIIVEYLINLNQISKEEVFLVVAPLKIGEGDGAPARCFVIEDE